jgi:hypothetical protein
MAADPEKTATKTAARLCGRKLIPEFPLFLFAVMVLRLMGGGTLLDDLLG